MAISDNLRDDNNATRQKNQPDSVISDGDWYKQEIPFINREKAAEFRAKLAKHAKRESYGMEKLNMSSARRNCMHFLQRIPFAGIASLARVLPRDQVLG